MKTPSDLWASKRSAAKLIESRMLRIVEEKLDEAPVSPGSDQSEKPPRQYRFIQLDLRSKDLNVGHLSVPRQFEIFNEIAIKLIKLGYEAQLSSDNSTDGNSGPLLEIYTQEG